MNKTGPDLVIFREVQQFRQPLIWALLMAILILIVAGGGWEFVQVLTTSSPAEVEKSRAVALVASAVAMLVVIGTGYLMYIIKLITEVREDGLYIRFYPFHLSFKKIPLEKVRTFYATTYRPILQYGGWGIRYGLFGTAYNVSGNRGVKFEFIKGRHLLIGSQRPEELAHALEEIMNRPEGNQSA